MEHLYRTVVGLSAICSRKALGVSMNAAKMPNAKPTAKAMSRTFMNYRASLATQRMRA
jgi:hypothetical protein